MRDVRSLDTRSCLTDTSHHSSDQTLPRLWSTQLWQSLASSHCSCVLTTTILRYTPGESNVNLIREKCSDCHLNRNISAPVDEEVVWRGMRDYDPLLCKVQSLLSIDDITWGSLITVITGVYSPIWGDRALSYEWVITPGLLREALATVLIPAPPPRDTHWSPAPAQKLMLFCQDLRSLL